MYAPLGQLTSQTKFRPDLMLAWPPGAKTENTKSAILLNLINPEFLLTN
jgi:hypothetical protein